MVIERFDQQLRLRREVQQISADLYQRCYEFLRDNGIQADRSKTSPPRLEPIAEQGQGGGATIKSYGIDFTTTEIVGEIREKSYLLMTFGSKHTLRQNPPLNILLYLSNETIPENTLPEISPILEMSTGGNFEGKVDEITVFGKKVNLEDHDPFNFTEEVFADLQRVFSFITGLKAKHQATSVESP